MDKQPFFSIIIPAYNVENYIEECLDSILQQDCKDCEIIIVDDGSKDGTGKICDQYKEKYEAVRVFHQENQGQSSARNYAIQNARGKYLLFVDSDDMIVKQCLGKFKAYIAENQDYDVIIMRRTTINSCDGNLVECQYRFDYDKFSSMHVADILTEIDTYQDFWFGPWVFCCNKEFVCENKYFFYQGIVHEDEEWIPKIILNASSVGFWNGLFYCNRIDREGSTTASLSIKRLFDRLKIVELLEKDFPCEKYEKKIVDAVQLRRCKLVFGVLCEVNRYRKDDEIEKLLNKTKKSICILKMSKKTIHKVAFFGVTLIGVKTTSYLLWRLKNGVK